MRYHGIPWGYHEGTGCCFDRVVVVVTGIFRYISLNFRYDFGITAWTVLNIKAEGADNVTRVYYYLDTHSEILGLLVAGTAIGGSLGGVAGQFVSACLSLAVIEIA